MYFGAKKKSCYILNSILQRELQGRFYYFSGGYELFNKS